jgi:hypothetical protein
MSIGKILFFSNVCMSASVGNTINHALPRLHDIEAISRDRENSNRLAYALILAAKVKHL